MDVNVSLAKPVVYSTPLAYLPSSLLNTDIRPQPLRVKKTSKGAYLKKKHMKRPKFDQMTRGHRYETKLIK